MSIDVKIPKESFPKNPIYPGEKEFGLIRDLPDPVEWAEKHFKLSTSYAHPGDFVAFEWQKEILRAILKYDVIIICGATRTFKSLGSEIMIAYCIDNLPANAMFIYSKREVVEEVFDERIKPLVREVPAIRKYWNGDEKTLTKKKTKLRHMIMRVGSAEVKSDIATFGAGIAYGSEVSKWRIKRGFDPVEALKRRQEDYKAVGRHKLILESSPLFEGDALHQEMTRPGVLALEPHFPCPSCGGFQVLEDFQIKEVPNKNGKIDHNPDRIRFEKAARYECIHCKKEIPDSARGAMMNRVKWASRKEKILKDGTIEGRIETKSVSFQWNRFVDYSFSFSECLARWFEGQRKGSESLQIYVNEDMARFWKIKTKRVSNEYLRSKCEKYSMLKSGDIPNEVIVLVAGIDTQDNGFYYVVNGYGKGMHKYLVRCDFVAAPKDEGTDGGKEKDPRQIAFERLYSAVNSSPFIRQDGKRLSLSLGFIDRGGHRPKDVDYITSHWFEIKAYIGSTRSFADRPIVYESQKGDFYIGQSERLTTEIGRQIDSAKWHLPNDCPESYFEQVLNEYFEESVDKWGNKKRILVKHEPNHYRSCENYCLAATKLEEFSGKTLQELLFDESSVKEAELLISNPGLRETEDSKTGADSEYFKRRQAW